MDFIIARAKLINETWTDTQGNYSPSAFLILNALIVVCSERVQEGILETATIADVARCAALPRETARRALVVLEAGGSVRRAGRSWTPVFPDASTPVLQATEQQS